MGMIAAIEARQGVVCIIARTERVRLSVISTTYCEVGATAGDGVIQVHTKAITCDACKAAVKALYGVAYDS